jgi:serine phosphatase RsbU (regulator of sigma subunit)
MWEANGLTGMGNAYIGTKEYLKAETCFLKSIKIQEEDLGDLKGQLTNYFNLAAMFYEMKQYEKAIDNSLHTLDILHKIGSFEYEVQVYDLLAKVYAANHQFDKAYDYHVRYLEMKDSVSALEGEKHVLEMQTKYETEKKENEIKALTQQNEIQDLQLNKNKVIIYAIIAGFILLVFMAIMIYKRYTLKRDANAQLEEQNGRIQLQKEIIEQKNKDITDSIIYAKRIQEAILPSVEVLRSSLKDAFVFFKPKDIVSGDFYFYEETSDGRYYFAAVDCTGHGVPGAFMSIVGHNALKQSINEFGKRKPAEILNQMNGILKSTLHSDDNDKSVKDGMDINLCCYDPSKGTLEYAGAFNPLWCVNGKELKEIKGDKFPIGEYAFEGERFFMNHEIKIQEGDCFYLFTDGFADQFGGERGKKFKYKNLQELLISMQGLDMTKQMESLDVTLQNWKGQLEQVDDILILGLKF